jgi:hypothetical protein
VGSIQSVFVAWAATCYLFFLFFFLRFFFLISNFFSSLHSEGAALGKQYSVAACGEGGGFGRVGGGA